MPKPRILIYAKATADPTTSGWLCREVLTPLIAQRAAVGAKYDVYCQVAFHKRTIRRWENNNFPPIGETRTPFVRFSLANIADLSALSDLTPPTGENWSNEMGSVTALAEFLSVSAKGGELGKDDTVVFWGHGGGWRGAVMNMPFRLRGEEFTFLRAEASKRISLWTESHFLEIIAHRLDDSHIQPREMRKAFAGHKVGLIAFNSCLMANLEVCYDLRDAADAVVASIDYLDEDEWSIPDWLASAAGKVSVELGKALIENVKSATPYGISRAISLIDTSKMKSVKLALDDFCRHVLLQSPSERVHRTKARKDALLFGKTYATTVDIHEYFLRLSVLDKNESFVRYVLAQVQASVIKKACVGPSYVGHPEIGGLTIFFPDSCTAARETYGYNRMLYHKDADSASTFIEESLWRNFLEWYWQDTCPAIT